MDVAIIVDALVVHSLYVQFSKGATFPVCCSADQGPRLPPSPLPSTVHGPTSPCTTLHTCTGLLMHGPATQVAELGYFEKPEPMVSPQVYTARCARVPAYVVRSCWETWIAGGWRAGACSRPLAWQTRDEMRWGEVPAVYQLWLDVSEWWGLLQAAC